MVGNRGYRRFLKVERGAVSLDAPRVEAEARFDGKYGLCTNTAPPAAEVAVQYKRLYLVEQLFRAATSLVDTRPIPSMGCHHQRTGVLFVSGPGAPG